ncbi:ATP-binding cassette domain-containing protein [Zunongwangia profunda]|uniref:ABC transporter ATP-binding protein n=1 Tax=Zunongwangia profunda TaxID=398743 RepID=A0A3D5J507_9FLAO|nr:ATP-binding cassette domain-containing protein [Zunongwangia profunda]MAS71785.1 ABC transporter ATP-binding protein [Zunongwangia sp.]HAJ82942.1 ABC transporter ATP-binding protein [Zunongwangia profunda]HCV83087.1 ABC transporter ATP-binding protein [Zunongwangia profunda]|tara:strand:+ start:4895 stop:5545 length:651 start_codon:yes stop_codon:yes gene_type:complete
MIFEIDNVELYFDNKPILKAAYIKAETGKVTGLLGRNGSGKSSILKILFGTLKPKYKLLRVDNKPVLKAFYKTGKITMLPQFPLLPPGIKTKKAFYMYKVDFGEFCDVFSEMYATKNQKIKELSGGEQRIIEIYLVLKRNVDIVLLDEPFAQLSPLMIDKFTAVIQQEKKDKAIIITDHRYEAILKVSDQVFLFQNKQTKIVKSKNELIKSGYLPH